MRAEDVVGVPSINIQTPREIDCSSLPSASTTRKVRISEYHVSVAGDLRNRPPSNSVREEVQ